jgi:hypothetical protein
MYRTRPGTECAIHWPGGGRFNSRFLAGYNRPQGKPDEPEARKEPVVRSGKQQVESRMSERQKRTAEGSIMSGIPNAMVFGVVALGLVLSGCSSSSSSGSGLVVGTPAQATSGSGGLTITGAGATFPFPLYSRWFYDYAAVDKSVRFNYQSIGSGGGIKQITAKTVDLVHRMRS